MRHNVDFITYIRDHVVVGDGAMATQLYKLGEPVGMCYEELNVTRSDVVADVHRSYYRAGARLIETNTFGANHLGLSRYGLEHQVEAINRIAVRVAREAVGDDAYVFGTIGSIKGVKRFVDPELNLGDMYVQQASALLSENPDGILLETFLDLEELLLAIKTIRTLSSVPIIAQLSLIDLGVTRDGYMVGDAFLYAMDAGAQVVGLNCRYGPADIARAYQRADLKQNMLLSAYPNAGLLSLTDGQYAYPSEPAYFAKSAKVFRDLGVRVIGGCCGTTPEHIAAIAEAVAQIAPRQPSPAPIDRAGSDTPILPTIEIRDVQAAPRARIHEKVLHEYTVIVELDPPKELSSEEFLLGAKALHDAGADAVTLADNSLAVMRMSNMALGALMKQQGVEPLLHISCRDRNLIGQQSHLMGLHALGIDQVLVITGDPSRFGDFPGASSVFDVSSFDMIRMIKQLNDGLAFSGRQLKDRSTFVVGAAFNPHVRHLDKAIRRLERKVEAGADFIMTQPIYDPAMFEILRGLTKHIPIPIFVGIMPLVSSRNAEFLHNEVPGITISDDARARMARYEGKRAREEGLAIARELLDAAMQYFHGIYLITPLLRYDMTVCLTEYVKERSRAQNHTG